MAMRKTRQAPWELLEVTGVAQCPPPLGSSSDRILSCRTGHKEGWVCFVSGCNWSICADQFAPVCTVAFHLVLSTCPLTTVLLHVGRNSVRKERQCEVVSRMLHLAV